MNIWAAWPGSGSSRTALNGSVAARGSGLRPHAGFSNVGSAIEDELALSTEAAELADRKPGGLEASAFMPGVPRGADGSIHLDDMRTYCEGRQNSLSARIEQLFDEAGIDRGQAIRLETGFDGSVVVANDHPQRRQIERLFQDHPELRDQFVEVDSLSSVIRAGDEAIAFQRAYARNPYAAVAQYSYLFDGSSRPQFSLLIQGDQYAVDFV